MKTSILIVTILLSSIVYAQNHSYIADIKPNGDYDNISVKKLDSDERVSTFIIWVKKEVKEHYHAEHSEVVMVLEGKGKMTLADESFDILPGDYIFIPKGTRHSVLVSGDTPVKVMSIQTPVFDGTDRVYTTE